MILEKLVKDTIILSIAWGDADNDGDIDLYLSTFPHGSVFQSATYNDANHAKSNVYLENLWNGKFLDSTILAGLTVNQNTFQSSFVDLNNDQMLDLVVATNTDTYKIFENIGWWRFEEVQHDGQYGFYMWLAMWDIDNDGDIDLFFSNVWNSIPMRFLKWDSREDQPINIEYVLLRNDGDFKFVDITAEKNLSDFEFAWGAVFEDFNLDGRLDLMVHENYYANPFHKYFKDPGRFFVQDEDGMFQVVTQQANADNYYYGNSPIVGDLNNDWYPDMIYANQQGPSFIVTNQWCENNYLKVKMKNNARHIGAYVTVEMEDWSLYTKTYAKGQGLMADQWDELIFGLGKWSEISSVKVIPISGHILTWESVELNSMIVVE